LLFITLTFVRLSIDSQLQILHLVLDVSSFYLRELFAKARKFRGKL
jgi:hypothetical protein